MEAGLIIFVLILAVYAGSLIFLNSKVSQREESRSGNRLIDTRLGYRALKAFVTSVGLTFAVTLAFLLIMFLIIVLSPGRLE
ncbi:MAG TPA: hypothetical protein VJH03_05865 [Blastocatellia bacterium]|nr:hypothetical protein [Blastocatellia bacterium]